MYLKKRLVVSSLLSSSLFLSSCASIVSHSHWPVTISSNPNGAAVVITDQQGREIHHATTPTTVTLSSKGGYFKGSSYMLTLTGKGGVKHTVQLNASLNAWFWGNFIFGGIPGFLIVDPLTGAMWTLKKDVTVDMAHGTLAATTPGTHTIRIVERSKIPQEWEGRLVAVHQP